MKKHFKYQQFLPMQHSVAIQEDIHKSMEINETIAGNLCRCTGYKQIIDAVKAV